MEEDIDYSGNDVHDIPGVETWRECSEHCVNHTGCEYWTHKEFDKDCFLKSSDSGRKSESHAVSGRKECKGDECYCCIRCHFSMARRGSKK